MKVEAGVNIYFVDTESIMSESYFSKKARCLDIVRVEYGKSCGATNLCDGKLSDTGFSPLEFKAPIWTRMTTRYQFYSVEPYFSYF
jgi:hypothetical protein